MNPCTHLCEEVVRRRYWKSLIPVNPLVCKSGSFVFWCSLLSSVLSFLYFSCNYESLVAAFLNNL